MTIAQYLRLLRQQWLVVALLTGCALIGSATYTALQSPVYQAEAQLFVSSGGQGTDLTQLTQISAFTQQRIKSYPELITSPRVLGPVAQDLHLGISAEALAGQVKASSPLDTVLINITVTDHSPTRARDIANAIAAQFPQLVNELETTGNQTSSPVKVTPTRDATVPTDPVSPRISLNLALGLLVGLGLGIGVAVLRDSLDRSIGDAKQAGDTAQAPVLGLIQDDPATPENPLIVRDSFSARAEAYRHLRTNIRFLSVDHQVRSIVVTGSVSGEGKTTTAANLAIALAQNGERVVLVDADLRRPSVADLFAVPAGVGLTTVLIGELDAEHALQSWHPDLPLQVLPSGPIPPNPSELIGSARMSELVQRLTEDGATVVIDSPPLLPVTDAAVLAQVTDGALVVTRAGSTRVDQLALAVETLRTAGAEVLGVVLNRMPRRGGSGSTAYHQGYSSYAPVEASGRAEKSGRRSAGGSPVPASEPGYAVAPESEHLLGSYGPTPAPQQPRPPMTVGYAPSVAPPVGPAPAIAPYSAPTQYDQPTPYDQSARYAPSAGYQQAAGYDQAGYDQAGYDQAGYDQAASFTPAPNYPPADPYSPPVTTSPVSAYRPPPAPRVEPGEFDIQAGTAIFAPYSRTLPADAPAEALPAASADVDLAPQHSDEIDLADSPDAVLPPAQQTPETKVVLDLGALERREPARVGAGQDLPPRTDGIIGSIFSQPIHGQALHGHSTNGHPTNGHPVNGHPVNGHSVNGHSVNGHPVESHPASGTTDDGAAELAGPESWTDGTDPEFPTTPSGFTERGGHGRRQAPGEPDRPWRGPGTRH